MTSQIPPKPRETARQTYYTKGETDDIINPTFVKSHISEPFTAATVLQRNPSHYEEISIKPRAQFIRTGGYTPGLYSGRCEQQISKPKLLSPLTSLSEAKILKKREFSE